MLDMVELEKGKATFDTSNIMEILWNIVIL